MSRCSPFGFGLSYTTLHAHGARIAAARRPRRHAHGARAPHQHRQTRDGDEVAQLYVRPRVASAVTGKRLRGVPARAPRGRANARVVEFPLPRDAPRGARCGESLDAAGRHLRSDCWAPAHATDSPAPSTIARLTIAALRMPRLRPNNSTLSDDSARIRRRFLQLRARQLEIPRRAECKNSPHRHGMSAIHTLRCDCATPTCTRRHERDFHAHIFRVRFIGAAIAAVLASSRHRPGPNPPTPRCAARRPPTPTSPRRMSPPARRAARRRAPTAATRSPACRPARIASTPGAGTETDVTLSVASTATLDLGASSGAVEAERRRCRKSPSTGRRLNEVRTSEVGTTVSQQQIETVPQMTRNFLEFADTVPGVVFEVDGQRTHVDPRRRAERQRREPLHRRRGPEGLRALGRQRPGRRHAGQSVPAARHRRIQGHHVQLQGGIRPDLERGHHRPHPLGHQRVRGRRPSARTPPTTSARGRRARSHRRQKTPSRRARNTASRSAARSSRTACISSSPTKRKRYRHAEDRDLERQSHRQRRRALPADAARAARPRIHRLRRRPVLREARLGD